MTDYTEPGTVLPNGAIVVASRYLMGPRDEAIVLCLTNGMAGHPYATWRMHAPTGVVVSGDYCLTFEGAIRSYAARSGFAVETLDNGTVPAEDRAKDVTPYGGEALLRMRGRLFDGQPYEDEDEDRG